MDFHFKEPTTSLGGKDKKTISIDVVDARETDSKDVQTTYLYIQVIWCL